VPRLVADLPAAAQEVGGRQQFTGREADLSGEVVRMPDHGCEDLTRPGVLGRRDGSQHLGGDLLARHRLGRRGAAGARAAGLGSVDREVIGPPTLCLKLVFQAHRRDSLLSVRRGFGGPWSGARGQVTDLVRPPSTSITWPVM
jgi:hypothetical protein